MCNSCWIGYQSLFFVFQMFTCKQGFDFIPQTDAFLYYYKYNEPSQLVTKLGIHRDGIKIVFKNRSTFIYNYPQHVLVYWKHRITISLSIESNTSFSMYTTKISFNHLSPILLQCGFFTIFINGKTLSTKVVAIGKINANLTNKYTKGYCLSLFIAINFCASLPIPFNPEDHYANACQNIIH